MKLTYTSTLIALISNLIIFFATYSLHDQVFTLLMTTSLVLTTSIWLVYKIGLHETKSQLSKANITNGIERRLSQRDPFANHPNSSLLKRVQFADILKQAIENANQLNKHFAILLVNLEPSYSNEENNNHQNKLPIYINGTLNNLKSMLKPEDTVAYINDDELVILISDLDKPKLAGNIAQRIIDHFARPHVIKGLSTIIKTTVGIAIYPSDGATIDEIIENAQIALHKAKISGKQLLQYHSTETPLQEIDHKNIQAIFKQALKNHQIQVLYQPIFDLTQGDVTSVQALLRWEHPQLGIINPEVFIATAEETSTLGQLSEWVFREACEKIKYWNHLGYGQINVLLKISPSQFLLPTLPKIIQHAIIQSGVNPQHLHLNISESIIMKNIDVATKILDEINATGVTLGIDHFGSSYTSIAHIDKFHIKYITIDKALIASHPAHPTHSNSIMNAIIALGKEFGFQIIAEGVETAEQLDYLINQKCDKALGYLLSYPVTAEKINYQFNKTQTENKVKE